MSVPSVLHRLRQAQHYAGAVAGASPLGKILYVDSANGVDGDHGLDELHPLLTLTQAIALADAGDTIVCAPGGSETVTATLAVAVARLKIVCPVANPASGFAISGAGTLDLMTVSAADCHVEGLRFAHTGATSDQAGIITTAAADRLVVRNCAFDDSAIVTNFTGFGVEVTDAVNDLVVDRCQFLDMHRGVLFATATGVNVLRPTIKDSTFFVGRATAFGIHASPAGTGTVRGLIVDGCRFVEANGDGSAAAAAWNGTDGTDATRGPILFGAAVDQFLIANCRAFTALAQAFTTLNAINAGAAGDVVSSASGVGSDTTAAVDSVGVVASTAASAAVVASTAASSALSGVVSYGLVGSTANSSSLSAVVSHGLATSTGLSSALSYGVTGSTAHSSSLSAVVSHGAATSTGLSSALSYGVTGSTAHSSSLSAITSYGVAGSTANSSGLSATVSYGVAGSTAHSSSLSATVSYGVAGSTAHSSSLSAAVSVGVVANAVGKPVSKVGSLADTAIDNNTQGAGNTLCTASGDVLIEDVIISKDGTNFTGPTNIEITSNNTYGDTGVNDPVALVSTATFAANTRIAALGTAVWSTLKLPMVLESTKKLYIHGDDLAGSSGGNTRYCVIGRALSTGGGLT